MAYRFTTISEAFFFDYEKSKIINMKVIFYFKLTRQSSTSWVRCCGKSDCLFPC